MLTMNTGSLPQKSSASTQGPNQQQPLQRAVVTGLRYPSSKRSIYDRNLNRSRTGELSRASFAYLFSEMVSYAQKRVTGITGLEKRLNVQGYPIGLRLLDLLLYRSPTPFSSTGTASSSLRPTTVLQLLQFISTVLWKHLFGRPADALERSQDSADEYMISDNDPLVNTYISIPKEMSQLNCAAFVAGIIEGVCDGSQFFARVTAHSVSEDETVSSDAPSASKKENMWPGKTIFLIKFQSDVMERETLLSRGKT